MTAKTPGCMCIRVCDCKYTWGGCKHQTGPSCLNFQTCFISPNISVGFSLPPYPALHRGQNSALRGAPGHGQGLGRLLGTGHGLEHPDSRCHAGQLQGQMGTAVLGLGCFCCCFIAAGRWREQGTRQLGEARDGGAAAARAQL